MDVFKTIYDSITGFLESTGAVIHPHHILPPWALTGVLGWVAYLVADVVALVVVLWHGVEYNRLVEEQKKLEV